MSQLGIEQLNVIDLCLTFRIFTDNTAILMNSLFVLQVDTSSATPTGTEQISSGTFVSSSQVLCVVPDAMATSSLKWGVRVAVSNNGQRKSTWLNLIGYNSVCYDCSNIACPMTVSFNVKPDLKKFL